MRERWLSPLARKKGGSSTTLGGGESISDAGKAGKAVKGTRMVFGERGCRDSGKKRQPRPSAKGRGPDGQKKKGAHAGNVSGIRERAPTQGGRSEGKNFRRNMKPQAAHRQRRGRKVDLQQAVGKMWEKTRKCDRALKKGH